MTSHTAHSALLRRFPSLAQLPRASLGVVESPVETWDVDDAQFWVKRDDLNCERLGGNKVRALEFLLGPRRPGDTVLTVGGIGSTHVLATAVHGASAGVATRAYRWSHERNDLTEAVDRAIRESCVYAPTLPSAVHAFVAAGWRRLAHSEHWIPFGGTCPLGMVGHVAAALELAEQVQRGELPEPQSICVALGTGGTAAGLALGLAIAGVQSRVVGVRCGPSVGIDLSRLRWLSRRVADFLDRSGAGIRRTTSPNLEIAAEVYAGAYARPHEGAERLRASVTEQLRLGLDATYSAKACYAAAMRARETPGPVLFWHTFDARWLVEARVANR
ncbi:MAG: 1-aminocyclopropane-1-carboxylate deaminase/D-cysteine desulfhydrase [Gemmatimonadaceae bacterium]